MLSRTASNLYWMARYLERAESTARLLTACFQPGLPFDGEISQLHALPLKIQGSFENFSALHNGNINGQDVINFMIGDLSFASVRTCLENARENARSERSRLSSEVWEAINQTWIEFKHMQFKPLNTFADWLKQRAFVFQGAINITMPASLSRYFIRLGTSIERADQTLRVLEAKGVLRDLSNQSDHYHWHMLLRSVSSYEAFQENVVGSPSNESVFAFLLFHKSLPRSVRYSVEKIEQLLNSIGSANNLTSMKIAARMLVKLKYDNVEDIAKVGQNNYIQTLQNEILQLGVAIHEGYFVIT